MRIPMISNQFQTLLGKIMKAAKEDKIEAQFEKGWTTSASSTRGLAGAERRALPAWLPSDNCLHYNNHLQIRWIPMISNQFQSLLGKI
jgi:hypothetical protein